MSALPDVCMIVEGTYPYVAGGVSAWIQDLIASLPQFTFSVVHLGSVRQPDRIRHYAMPNNVVALHEFHIHDPRWLTRTRGRSIPSSMRAALRDLHSALASGRPYDAAALFARLGPHASGRTTAHDLFYADASWDLLLEYYRANVPSCSFVDYFWTFRFTHLPLFYLIETPLPEARLYHAVCAGYNAFAGALAKARTGAPLLITEHGIYTREREIEIAQAEWIYSESDDGAGADLSAQHNVLQQVWIDIFRGMTKLSYDAADHIVSITAANQRYQRLNGADPDKLMVIPNGIDVERLSEGATMPSRADGDSGVDDFVVGFVGRVVPIKDVKTFIRAITIARALIPRLRAYIVGPQDEDASYAAECRRLAEDLGLDGVVEFTGPADVRDYYRQIDVLVLTSLSEAQPLVVLEANGVGVPVVAPDVGACRELLTGITPDDRALGPSGILTPPAAPEATAAALARLAGDAALRRRFAAAGRERVRRFYHKERLSEAYDALYGACLAASPITKGA